MLKLKNLLLESDSSSLRTKRDVLNFILSDLKQDVSDVKLSMVSRQLIRARLRDGTYYFFGESAGGWNYFDWQSSDAKRVSNEIMKTIDARYALVSFSMNNEEEVTVDTPYGYSTDVTDELIVVYRKILEEIESAYTLEQICKALSGGEAINIGEFIHQYITENAEKAPNTADRSSRGDAIDAPTLWRDAFKDSLPDYYEYGKDTRPW